jgi:hypothetical protein
MEIHDKLTLLQIEKNRLEDMLNELKEDNTFKWGPAEGFVIKSEMYMNLGGKYSRLDLRDVERYDKNIRNKIIGWCDDE